MLSWSGEMTCTGQVAHALRADLVAAADDDQYLATIGEVPRNDLALLVDGVWPLTSSVIAWIRSLRPIRQRTAQCGGDHLLGVRWL